MLLEYTSEFAEERVWKAVDPYLSHEIRAECIRATPKIAKGVMDLPFLKSHKGVLSFIELPQWQQLLYELSEDQKCQGRDLSRAHESFEFLKRKIVATLMLRHPDIQKPFVVIPHANRCGCQDGSTPIA
ncbi:hypothetical protein PHMEG_00011612 [Phytophthora megakarya]|uniref:Reverse transcriptase n=1 Tax=Phytophthora megakarya TaxID=4795 RepID=A0A225WDB9_9STRA|nr:hypothetical protein PHMEG_00011612 [Phytophthora megakarya]